MLRKFFLIVVAGLLLASASLAQTSNVGEGDLPDVSGVRVSSTPERARLVVDISKQSAFSFVSLADPKRIAVDVLARNYQGETEGQAAGEGLIERFTLVQMEENRFRTILFLSDNAQVQQAYVLEAFDDQPARLVVDIVGATQAEFEAKVAADRRLFEAETQTGTASGADEVAAIPVVDAGVEATATTRPLVLIDPGHGGVDGGATAADGTREKTITLQFALQLQEVLIATGLFDVALTREDDSFFRLEDRVQLARDNKADLMISVHADSFDDKAIRGASVYIRDEQATDVLDKVLADSENKVDLLAGFSVPSVEPVVVDILVDLMRREMRRLSFVAADAIVDQLKSQVRVRRFPLRRAAFFVLQSPDIPAVLVELGFLSNDSDVQNLTSQSWRRRAAEAVGQGVVAYFERAGQ